MHARHRPEKIAKNQHPKIYTIQTHNRAAFQFLFLEMSVPQDMHCTNSLQSCPFLSFFDFFFGNVYHSQCPRIYTVQTLQSCLFLFLFFWKCLPKSVPQDIHYTNSQQSLSIFVFGNVSAAGYALYKLTTELPFLVFF